MRTGIAFLFLSAVSVFPITACAPGEAEGPDLNAEAAAIREANRAWLAAEREGNVDAIMPFIAEDAVFQPQEAPPFSGLEAIRQFYEDFFSLGGVDISAGPEQVILSSSGDLAYHIGTNYLVTEGPEGQARIELKYLGVWKKIEGQWQAVAVAWSTNAPTES